jgi:hypothetical protein
MCICGIANDGDSRFCKSCGQKLWDEYHLFYFN